MDKKELLKQTEKDLNLDYISNIDSFTGTLFLIFSLCSFVLGVDVLFDVIREEIGKGAIFIGIFCFSGSAFVGGLTCTSWIDQKKLNKRYGKANDHFERIEQIISILRKKYNINELMEYYPFASKEFQTKILEKICADEIANKYNIEDKLNHVELFDKLLNKDKVEIENS